MTQQACKTPTKTDVRAADRLLRRAVAVGRAYLATASTDADYKRISEANAVRFSNAIHAAELLVEDPTTEGKIAC